MSIIYGEYINESHIENSKSIINESLEKDRDIIIFDIGSVLVDGDFDKALLQDPRIPNEFIEDLKKAWFINDSKFTETCSKEEYIKVSMDRAPENMKYYIPTVAEVAVSYLEVLPHTYSLINELRKEGYSLYYLSNWDSWSSKELIRNGKFDFLNLLDGGLFSCDAGCMKPDSSIYKCLLMKYNIDPNKAIFLDDKKENIEAANKLGIQGILFTDKTGGDILKDFILNESVDEVYEEKAMTSKERNDLDNEDFGIPEVRKYPLHDKKHVEQAIKMFNHVEKKYEAELADNLLDAMERYHISTDVVGDNNRLKKYIKEDAITEGVFKDETPKEIKKLGENIKKILEDKDEDISGVNDAINVAKDTLKGKDFSGEEKSAIYTTCKKLGINIHGYTKKKTSVKGVKLTNNHAIIGTYKEYILTLKFLGIKGDIKLAPLGIKVSYNGNTSEIPKGVAFDFLSMFSPSVDKVKSTKRSINVSALSNAIDSGYPRAMHKYITKYGVKKNVGGMSVTLSTYNVFKESSPVSGAMHRQDYQPDAVYIVNYLKKNTVVRDLAICKDKMSSIFVCDNGEPIHISLTDFKEMADDVKVYKCLYDTGFKSVLRSSKSGLDFYKNMVNDDKVEIATLESDYRFTKVSSYIDELNSIEECIINSAPKSGFVHEVYCPVIPLVDLNSDESAVHYFRDVNGVFAQNIDSLARSASYKNVEDIPKTTINILLHT